MGSNNNPLDLHPKFGFSQQQMINTALTGAAPTGSAVQRPAGVRSVVAVGIFTLSAGTGEVSLILEGSNDGTNWFVVSQTALTEYFTTNGQTQVLNDAGDGLVDLEHLRYVRVRTVTVSGTPTYSLQVIVTGIARDCEGFVRQASFGPRLGATPTSQSSTSFTRPQGTLLTNVQVNASGVVLGTLTSFEAVLQGSPDGGTTWLDIGVATITGNGSQLMPSLDNETFFSLGAYYMLRFLVRDVGVANGVTAFTSIALVCTLEDCDWVIDDGAGGGGSSPFDPSNIFVSVAFGSPGAEAANTIDISGQIFDADGAPLAESRKIELLVYDTSQAGDLDLALNATFSAVGTGTAIAGVATNRVVLTTNASGQFTVSVLDVAVESVYVTAVTPSGPQTTPQIIAQSAEATLTFA
jgi:hypothetical protein